MVLPPTLEGVLAVPELLELVIPYLSSQDLARLCTTNKNHHRDLFPFLWRHLILTSRSIGLNQSTFVKYAHLIQSLDCSRADASTIQAFNYILSVSKPTRQMLDHLLWSSGQSQILLRPCDQPTHAYQQIQPNVYQVHPIYGLRRLNFLLKQTPVYIATPDSLPGDQGAYEKVEDEDEERYLRRIRSSQEALGSGAKMVDLLQLTPRLTHLSIPSNVLTRLVVDSITTKFFETLTRGLPQLESLTIESRVSGHYVSLERTLILLVRSLELPRLVELHCKFEVSKKHLETDTDDEEDEVIANFSDHYQELRKKSFQACLARLHDRAPERIPRRLQSLQLPNGLWPLDFLVPFFKTCVGEGVVGGSRGIRELAIPWIDHGNPMSDQTDLTPLDLSDAVRESCGSTIQHLTAVPLAQVFRRIDYTEDMKLFLRACDRGPGLKTFICQNGIEWQSHEIPDLVVKHAETLEVLIIHGSTTGDRGLAKIAQQCKSLRILHAPWFEDVNLDQSAVASSSVRWASAGTLTSLCVSMGKPLHHRVELDEPGYAESFHDLETHYWNLGGMTQLQDLTLGYSYLGHKAVVSLTDLMSEEKKTGGCLEYLAELQHLRRLCLRQDFWTRLDIEEIRFMARNWRNLEVITFRTNNIPFMRLYLAQVFCWRELKRFLPRVEYRFLHSDVSDVVIDTENN
ncbi:hypothetical protein BGZ83_008327 [Gryganskiella cystojenkinii]|nr:hypothetical protein BGZ83_008327 [Gryganskiella cystojenkinii]